MEPANQHTTDGNPLIRLLAGAKRIPSLPVSIVVALGVVILSSILGGITAIALLGREAVMSGQDTQAQSALLSGGQFALLLILSFAPIFLLLWIWLRLYEGRPFSSLGFVRTGAIAHYVKGLAGGILFFGASIIILFLIGGIRTNEPDPVMNGTAALGGVALVFVGWMIQGAGEEVLCRGWLLQVVGGRTRIWTGIIASSFVFSVLHGINPNIGLIPLLNIALVGVFLSLYALREGAIWGVSGWHATWNWMQGNVLGLEVSGARAQGGSLLSMSTDGWELISGGAFGPEGGLAVTIVLIAGVVYFLKFRRPDFTLPELRPPSPGLPPPLSST